MAKFLAKAKVKPQCRAEKLKETPTLWAIVTDASPFGVGGMLLRRSRDGLDFHIQEAFEAPVTETEARLLKVEWGEASSQAVLEAYAVLRAIKLWQRRLTGENPLVKADSAVALAILRQLGSSSPSLNYVAAEIGIMLEECNIGRVELEHIPGAFSTKSPAG